MTCPNCGGTVPSLTSLVDGRAMCSECLRKHTEALILLAKGTKE